MTTYGSQDSRSRTRSLVSMASVLPPSAGLILRATHHPVGVVSNVSNNLLADPVSGLLGLAFQSIASSGARPLWQALVDTPETLDAPLMAFHLTRFINGSDANSVEPGGSCTVGAVNHTLFNGDIDYQPVDGATGYWTLQISCKFSGGDAMTTILFVYWDVSAESRMPLQLSLCKMHP